MSILPPLSEIHLPNTLREEDIEILKNPIIRDATNFSLSNVFFSLFSRNDIVPSDELQIISCHPTLGIVAMIYHSTIMLYALEDLLSNSKPSPTVLKYTRFEGNILSFSWTYENQSTFLVGTTAQLYYIELSSFQKESKELGNADFHTLTLPMTMPINQISVSPQGRYCACRSHAVKGCILILDTWQNQWQYYYVFNSWTTIEQVSWTLTGQNILVTASTGEVILIDTYRWQKQSFFLTNTATSFQTMQWMTAQSLVCTLPHRNDIYRLYLEESLADNQLYNSADPYQINNTIHLNSHPYTLTTLHHREGLVIKQLSTSMDGNYLAVAYATTTSNNNTSTNVNNNDHGMYPKIDIFLMQKDVHFALTYVRTISKHIPYQSNSETQPASPVFPLSMTFLPTALTKDRVGGLILLIFWSDLTVTSHKV